MEDSYGVDSTLGSPIARMLQQEAASAAPAPPNVQQRKGNAVAAAAFNFGNDDGDDAYR